MATRHQSSGASSPTLRDILPTAYASSSPAAWDPSTTSAWSYLANLNLADASVQLASIDLQIRERLYAEYCAQCADLAPYLHQRGRRVGQQLLTALLVPSDPPGTVKYEEDVDREKPNPDRLVECDPLLVPVLDPFVAGLTEPFQAQYTKIQRNVVLTFIAGSVASGLVGYLLGRYVGKRR
ncbi:g11598 [Coccomyxa elongata]